MGEEPYPRWTFFPNHASPPEWVKGIVTAFSNVEADLDSQQHHGITSDDALAALRPALEGLGYQVEVSKKGADKISRPVLFGGEGKAVVSYEVDAYNTDHKVVVEIEAGRGAANNADYRDLVRASLMVDADYLVLAMMLRYSSGKSVWRSYERAFNSLDAIYKSERLKLPLKGVLLVGY